MTSGSSDQAGDYVRGLEGSSTRRVLGNRLWLMIWARRILRVWPSDWALEEQQALRGAQLQEDLRVHVARDVLDNGNDEQEQEGDR